MKKSQYLISGVPIEVTRKKIKNLNLRIYPTEGRVTVSCPRFTAESTIREFVSTRIDWIKKHLEKGKNQKKKILSFITGENIQVWGTAKELKVYLRNKKPQVFLNGSNEIYLYVRPGSDQKKREKILDEWYRHQLKSKIPGLISHWENVMNVSVNDFGVKKMKTRWGTCNIRDRRIWLNLELAKKVPACLEFIVVHEMVHLLERLHSKRFYRLMDQFLPDWREKEKLLYVQPQSKAKC